ncbi:MAG: DUF1553 domain-containing protein [Verrucomicrobiae bacterium]|nr:DUF1553 domain-containing protein [Verrucomicrobiae bacterium]
MAALALVLGTLPAQTTEQPVSFRHDVMAVLSKAGCSAGACHGNASGKGGFQLSLRGENPVADHVALTEEAFGRRIHPNEPDQSLLLLKATARIPHEGGTRFAPGTPEYAILRAWIAAGAPMDPQDHPTLHDLSVHTAATILHAPVTDAALRTVARFSDGTERDVSRLAVYEPTRPGFSVSPDGLVTADLDGEVTVLVRYLHRQVPVRLAFVPDRPGFAWPDDVQPRNVVDEPILAKLRLHRLQPAPEVDDLRFLRRAHLDLLGTLPATGEALDFLANPDPQKRSRLVETLLQRPQFAEFWALKWSDLLRNEEKALDRKGVDLFHRWIRDAIASGMPMDRFARELLTARGSTYENPPASFYRSLRTVPTRAETVAQVFLGTRLGCAQCHNHPYDRWTQDDYHEWSAIFARIRYKVLENRYPDTLDTHGFTGEQIVLHARDGESRHPASGRILPARLLGDAEPLAPSGNRLDALAAWLTRPDHPLFARVQVNRIWFHLMGRGLVDPVDDFRPTNPASHPELLDTLAADFVAHGFDLRRTIRLIMASRTYQTESRSSPMSHHDDAAYAHVPLRRLTAEQALDALAHVTGASPAFAGYPDGLRATQIPGVQAVRLRGRPPGQAEQFLRVFGKPDRLLASEEERSCQTNLGQAFQLMTGPLLADLLARPGNRLDQLLASGAAPDALIEDLFWTALTRPPTPPERDALRRHFETGPDPRQALEDIAWALVNAKEFVFRH